MREVMRPNNVLKPHGQKLKVERLAKRTVPNVISSPSSVIRVAGFHKPLRELLVTHQPHKQQGLYPLLNRTFSCVSWLCHLTLAPTLQLVNEFVHLRNLRAACSIAAKLDRSRTRLYAVFPVVS